MMIFQVSKWFPMVDSCLSRHGWVVMCAVELRASAAPPSEPGRSLCEHVSQERAIRWHKHQLGHVRGERNAFLAPCRCGDVSCVRSNCAICLMLHRSKFCIQCFFCLYFPINCSLVGNHLALGIPVYMVIFKHLFFVIVFAVFFKL